MNLFPYEPTRNLLPFDGIANYYGPILASREAQGYLEPPRSPRPGSI
jgi:hypothetical protein